MNLIDYIRPFEFYSHILNTYGGRRKFVARLGYEAEDGLDEFLNLCLDFEQSHIPVMQLFINWMEKDEVEIKRELEQSSVDAVRIMTVHGSKGLQAPYVIMPDTSTMKSVNNEMGLLVEDDVLFYPLCAADYENNCRNHKEKEKLLRKEEYHRLLYVALTRAEECLCLCGYKNARSGNGEESWYEMCRNAFAKIEVCVEPDKSASKATILGLVFPNSANSSPKAPRIDFFKSKFICIIPLLIKLYHKPRECL